MQYRKKFEKMINDYQDKIHEFDKQFVITGDPNYALYRDHQIKLLVELKEHILSVEAGEKP